MDSASVVSTIRLAGFPFRFQLISVVLGCWAITLIAPSAGAQERASAPAQTAVVRIDVNPKHILNSFDPDRSLGSSIDVLSRSGIDKVYTPHIIQESLSAGWGPITYRNNTELRMAA
jgi:hypothetical protein